MKHKIYVYLFFIIIFIVPIINIFTADREKSDTENRHLQQLPKLEGVLEGDFQSAFDKYTSDQIILRDEIVSLKNYIEIGMMKLEVNGVYINNPWVERHSDKDYDKELMKKNIEIIETFKEKYNAEIYLVANACFSDDYYGNNVDISDVPYVYYDDLEFYKTDHHWTTLAAYNLYKKIVDNPVEYNPVLVSDSFLGTINNKLNISMKPDSIYRHDSDTNFTVYYDMGKKDLGFYFDKYLETKDKYSYFLDGNHGLVEVVNEDIDNDERILIIKDSYANCFVPFIAENYKEVDVIDLRYFNMKMSYFIKDYDRIIFLYNVDNFLNNTYLTTLTQ